MGSRVYNIISVVFFLLSIAVIAGVIFLVATG